MTKHKNINAVIMQVNELHHSLQQLLVIAMELQQSTAITDQGSAIGMKLQSDMVECIKAEPR